MNVDLDIDIKIVMYNERKSGGSRKLWGVVGESGDYVGNG